MARRMPKFPLKMANGANVRNLEDLRTNADIESIVSYYLSGQLSLWCRAFGYDAFPKKIEIITFELIKSIYTVLEIPVSEQEIKNYIKENGIHVKNTAANDTETEEEVIDNTEVKKKLKSYVNSGISLSDYAVEVMPVNDNNGKLCKYKITVVNAKTEQYTSFVLPYDISSSYTKEKFLDDLFKKIANVLEKLEAIDSYNKLKNSRYAGLKVGDTFEFGNYEGKSIIWRVLSNNGTELFCISDKILCDKKIEDDGEGNNNWKECSLRRWLNQNFYDKCFTSAEKQLIIKSAYNHQYSNDRDKLSDYFYLLSETEVEKYFDKHTRITNGDYWTRTAQNSGGSHYMRIVNVNGESSLKQAWRSYRYDASGPPVACGVRPVFTLKY